MGRLGMGTQPIPLDIFTSYKSEACTFSELCHNLFLMESADLLLDCGYHLPLGHLDQLLCKW